MSQSQLPTASVKSGAENLEQMPVMQHLVVLRRYLFKIVGVILFLFFLFITLSKLYLSITLRSFKTTTSSNIYDDCNGCHCDLYGAI